MQCQLHRLRRVQTSPSEEPAKGTHPTISCEFVTAAQVDVVPSTCALGREPDVHRFEMSGTVLSPPSSHHHHHTHFVFLHALTQKHLIFDHGFDLLSFTVERAFGEQAIVSSAFGFHGLGCAWGCGKGRRRGGHPLSELNQRSACAPRVVEARLSTVHPVLT